MSAELAALEDEPVAVEVATELAQESGDANINAESLDARDTSDEAETAQSTGAFATLSEAEDAGAVAGVPDDPEAYIENEVIVVLAGEDSVARELETVEESLSALSDTDDAVEAQLLSPALPDSSDGSTALVELPADVSVQDALLELANDDRVAFAQPNYRYTLLDDASEEGQVLASESQSALELLYTPNDPKANDSSDYGQWWLGTVNAFQAWDQQKVEGTVGVAVIDTGVRLTHRDLDDNIVESLAWDAHLGEPLSKAVGYQGDVSGHGTLVSGVVAAEANNNFLGAGVSFNAKIVPINIFYPLKGGGITADTSTIVKAFDYIIAHRAEANIRVVNMSLGGYSDEDDDKALHQKIQQAKNLGILSVAAAGNGNTYAACYPSDYDEVVSVVAVNKNLSRWAPMTNPNPAKPQDNSGSDFNANKDIAAPGSGIYTTHSSSDTAESLGTGTSLATPVVSGIAALLFAKNPDLTPDQVKSILCQTATDLIESPGSVGRDDYYGWGLVNADAALTAVPAIHTVTLNPSGGSVTPTTVTKTHDATIGDLPTPTRTHYTFDGWYTEAAGGTKITTTTKVTADVTYYAHWNVVSYTATFNSNNGVAASPSTITRAYDTALGTLPTTSRTGYTFAGWFTAATGGTQISATTKMATHVTYYAHWNVNSYTATFNSNGGNAASPPTITKTYNTDIGTLPIATRAGYALAGWYTEPTGGTKIATTTKVIAHVTYYAHWTIGTYTATFNSNGGSAPSPASVTKNYNTDIGALPTPTRTGYTFDGWYTAVSGGTKISTTTKVTANVTYYAHWNINSYTVTFNSSGGSAPSPATVTKNYNTDIGTLPNPTRSGHAFDGWYTQASGGTKITTTTKVTANVTYYAHWAATNLDGNIVALSSALSRSQIFDIPASSKAAGVAPVIWNNGQWPNQRFKLVSAGGGYYLIQNVNSGLVLDVYDGKIKNSAALIQWPSNGGNNQRWKFILNTNGSYTIVSKANESFCIDLPNSSVALNTKPILYALGSNKANQQFYLEVVSRPLANGVYTVGSAASSVRFVDIEGASRNNGAAAILWSKNAGDNQKFRFTYNANTGYYSITAAHSGRALDVYGASTVSGARVIQWSPHSDFNQQWRIVSATGGTYAIYSAPTGLALDVNGGSTAAGASLIMWPYHGGANQRWILSS
ncbi:MAG: RICIN domain-containing protein [Coriobacteriales bacterium]|nr:RICIN domain-containing protein [Coriobacteriales bacterium]